MDVPIRVTRGVTGVATAPTVLVPHSVAYQPTRRKSSKWRASPGPAGVHSELGARYRVAVRAIEAWLLADAERLAKYLGIPRTLVPRFPDQGDHPKRTLVNLARRSRKRAIREGMTPRQGSGVQVGPEYLSCV